MCNLLPVPKRAQSSGPPRGWSPVRAPIGDGRDEMVAAMDALGVDGALPVSKIAPFPVHSHMLRHACGPKLANDGHDTRAIQAYLGHRSIMSTVRYTALTPNRFKNFWKDCWEAGRTISLRELGMALLCMV
jgi:integrase